MHFELCDINSNQEILIRFNVFSSQWIDKEYAFHLLYHLKIKYMQYMDSFSRGVQERNTMVNVFYTTLNICDKKTCCILRKTQENFGILDYN